MIIAYYDGMHFLDLLSSFQNSAWSAMYGSYPQDDPLFGCLSNLKKECLKHDIQLEYGSTWLGGGKSYTEAWREYETKNIPCIFFISGYSKKMPLSEILKKVYLGANLVVLHSFFMYPMYKNECVEMLNELKLTEDLLADFVRSKKVQIYGKGKIFYIDSDSDVCDGKIERGPFGGRSEADIIKSKSVLTDFVQKVSKFSCDYVDCCIKSIPSTWPKDENLIIEIELRNKSENLIPTLVADVSFLTNFEPLSNTCIQVDNLGVSERQITLLCVPRSKGKFDCPISVTLTYNEISYSPFIKGLDVNVLDNLHNLLRSSKPLQIDIANGLPRYSQFLKPVVTPEVILNLLDVDPDSVVSKVRRVGENIAKNIARKKIVKYDSTWSFANITKELHERRIISSKAKGYIDTIRIFGNMASHSDEKMTVSFSHEDALVVLHSLLLFLKEVTETNTL